jgi:hypothetical protein
MVKMPPAAKKYGTGQGAQQAGRGCAPWRALQSEVGLLAFLVWHSKPKINGLDSRILLFAGQHEVPWFNVTVKYVVYVALRHSFEDSAHVRGYLHACHTGGGHTLEGPWDGNRKL